MDTIGPTPLENLTNQVESLDQQVPMTALFVSRNVSGGKSGFLAVAREEKTRKAIFARGKRLYRLSGSVQVSICEQLNGNENSVLYSKKQS